MLASFLLAVREGIEAALIIGIVFAALKKMGQANLGKAVWSGVAAAVLLSLAAGLALSRMGAQLEGRAEEIFEGAAMLAAAALLTWMIVWLHRQSKTLQKDLESGVKNAAGKQGSAWALFWLSFLAVGREGFELVLFLTAVQMTSGATQTFLGAALGLGSAAALGWLLFASSKRLSLRKFFWVTNVLLVLFAAGLLAHGVHEFNEAGVVPSIVEHVWDLNPLLNEKGTLGLMLTALFGYNANPSLSEIFAYLAYLLGVGSLLVRARRPLPVGQAV
jgi:high-affinity iron transporter